MKFAIHRSYLAVLAANAFAHVTGAIRAAVTPSDPFESVVGGLARHSFGPVPGDLRSFNGRPGRRTGIAAARRAARKARNVRRNRRAHKGAK